MYLAHGDLLPGQPSLSYLTPSNGPQWFASAQVRSPGWHPERLWASLWSGSCVKKLVLQILDSPRIIVCKDDPGTCEVGRCHGVVLTASRSVASHNARSSPSAGVCFVRVLLRNSAWTQDVGSRSGHTPDSNAPARSAVHGCSFGIAGRLSPFFRSPSDARIASARPGSPVRAAGHPLVGATTAAVPFPWPAVAPTLTVVADAIIRRAVTESVDSGIVCVVLSTHGSAEGGTCAVKTARR